MKSHSPTGLSPALPSAQPVDLATLTPLGHGLSRPESVLATADGAIWTAHWAGGGVSRIAPDGAVSHHLPSEPVAGVHPNGIALLPDGSFLLASLGDTGGVWRLTPEGEHLPFCTMIDGEPLPPSNFVAIDNEGRVWITVSTRQQPRALGYRRDIADGFIVCVDGGEARIVAEGLGYTNEALVSPCGGWLYVNETFARRLSRFRIDAGGALTAPETVARFGPGLFPDGLGFDEDGGIWIVSIVSNRVLRIAPTGAVDTILADADPQFLAEVEQAYVASTMGRPHLDRVESEKLRNISAIAFAGPDRRTAVLGCLLDDRLQSFAAAHAGVEPVHWHWPAPTLKTL